MATIVTSLTISGFKVFGTDIDGSEKINTSITSSGIYGFIDNSLTATSNSPQTIYLTNDTAPTKIGGAKTVDTLSVMVNTDTANDLVVVNGYTAVNATVSGDSSYDFYAPSGSSGSLLTYTLAAPSSGSGKVLNSVGVQSTYSRANAINVTEGSNVLIIEIFTSAGVKRATYTYNVVIVSSSTRLASLNPNLPVFQYSPVFNNSKYSPDVTQNYILSVPPSATEMTLTPVAVVSTQEISIVIKKPDGTALPAVVSGQASSSFTFVDNNSVQAIVTAADGETTQTYTISIQNDTGNNTLKTVALSYIPVSGSNVAFQTGVDAWSSGLVPTTPNLATTDSYNYLYCIPNNSRGLYLSVSTLDAFSTITVGGVTSLEQGTFLIPYNSLMQGAQNTITCVCTSSMGYSRTYTFTIWLAGEDNATLSIYSGSLNNISCVDGAAIIDPNVPFNPASLLTVPNSTGLAGFTIATTGLPVYTVYVAATTSATTSVTINLNYNDNGSRFSVLQRTSGAAGSWSPADINTVPTTPSTTISGDNWVLGSQRSITLTGVPVGTLTAADTNSVVIASHLPNGLYYGYGLRFVTPKASLNSLRLFNSTTGAQYTLNPTFSSIVESYTVYVGTASTPATTMDVNLLVGSAYKVDYTYALADAYNAANQIVSAVTKNVPVNSPGPLYVRLYDTATSTLQGYYAITLLNVDASLLLTALNLSSQNPINPNGTWPTDGSALTLSPAVPASLNSCFVYNTANPLTWCKLVPTVSNPTVKTITISIGSASQPVSSGSPYYFEMTGDSVLVNINIRDNLNPNNSNTYYVFVYSNSTNRNLKLANFSGIPNGSFSPNPLPDGLLYTAPITPSNSNITPVSYTCANALVTSTQFTATPVQAGTSMYIVQPNGFIPLLPGVASSSISLPTASTSTQVWMYANDNIAYGVFNFVINRIPSTNNNLSSMSIANVSGFTFSPAITDYNGISVIPPKTTTTFRAVSENVNSVIQWSINGSAYVTIASGVLSSTININPLVNNVLSLKVTAESGAIKFYTFNITRPYNSYLTDLKIFENVSSALAATNLTLSGVTINPSPFNSTFFTYSAEVASNIEIAYAVLYHSSESVVSMSNGSLYGLTTDGSAEVWAVPVQLSSVNPLVYQINPSNIVVSAGSSTNTYNLAVIRERSTAVAQSIEIYDSSNNLVQLRNSVGAPVSFDQFSFTYTIPQSYSGQTLRVEIVGQGPNIYLVNGVQYFVPVSYQINASYPIIVKAQSTITSNVYSLYQFSLL